MLVVKVYIWPQGQQKLERLLSQATISLKGIGQSSSGHQERSYEVSILKGVGFRGPADGDDVRPQSLPKSKVWRTGTITGHRPGGRGRAARGEWDLIGGALRVLLGDRLATYRKRDA